MRSKSWIDDSCLLSEMDFISPEMAEMMMLINEELVSPSLDLESLKREWGDAGKFERASFEAAFVESCWLISSMFDKAQEYHDLYELLSSWIENF